MFIFKAGVSLSNTSFNEVTLFVMSFNIFKNLSILFLISSVACCMSLLFEVPVMYMALV